MNKLTVILSGKELNILTGVLKHLLTGIPIKALQTEMPGQYLVFACLIDVYNQMSDKNRDHVLFGYRPGTKIKVSFKRHEAIAFHMLCTESDYPDAHLQLPALPNETITLIRSIHAQIHKTFFI